MDRGITVSHVISHFDLGGTYSIKILVLLDSSSDGFLDGLKLGDLYKVRQIRWSFCENADLVYH